MLKLATRRALARHYAISVQKLGWSGKNGKLLSLAVDNKFDAFLTADRNLAFQQNLVGFEIAVIVLEAPGVQLHQTLPLIPKLLTALPDVKPGTVTRVQP